MIQRRSSSESQDRAVWPSCTWPMYPPARDEEVGAPHDAPGEGRNDAPEELLLWRGQGGGAEAGAGNTHQAGSLAKRSRAVVIAALSSAPLQPAKWSGAKRTLPGAHIPHPIDLLRLASSADGDGDAEAAALPERWSQRGSSGSA